VSREDYDLLTAMLMGVAVGTAVTMLLRRGPHGSRPAGMLLSAAGAGATNAGKWAGRGARRGAEWVGDRGEAIRDRLPSLEDVAEELGDYMSAARETISDTVSDELRDLRKAIRKQRKRIGV
jgi:gas vesicle protein